MSEVEYAPLFELWKTDHGIDGLDAKTWLVAKFTTKEKAVAYLAAKGWTHVDAGWYWHHLREYRHTTGAISYEIRESKPPIPIDPTPDVQEASKR